MSASQVAAFELQLYKVWLHIQHELLYISWGLMEIALFTPISFSLLGWTRYWPADQVTLWLLLIMFLPFNLARLLSILDIPKSRQQSIMAVALFLTILFSIRALVYAPQSAWDITWFTDFFANIAAPGNQLWLRDVAIFFLVIIMWWRGLRLTTRQFDISQAGFRLRLGILIAPLAIWFSYISYSWNVTPFILLFFLAGLMTLTLIRAEQIEQSRSGFSASLSPRWLSLIFAASLLTVLLAGLLAAVISGQSLLTIAGWLSPFLSTLYLGGAVIISTLLYMMQPLITLLARLIDGLALWLQRIFANSWIDPDIRDDFGFIDLVATPTATDVVEVIAPPNFNSRLLAILLMTAVILVVSLFLGRLFRQAGFAATDSEIISAKETQDAEEGSLGQRLLNRLGLWRQWRAAASVRRIYRQMLKAAESSGFPRSHSETPFEYLATLRLVWPDNGADTQLITQSFVKVRYGELPETQEELDAIKAAWGRLREAEPAPADIMPHLEKTLPTDFGNEM